MKKYRQVLATLLAANLTVSLITLDVSAGTTAVVVHPVSYSAQNAKVQSLTDEKSAAPGEKNAEESTGKETTDKSEADASGKEGESKDTSDKNSEKQDNKKDTSSKDSQKQNKEKETKENTKTKEKSVKNAKKVAENSARIQAGEITLADLVEKNNDISQNGNTITVTNQDALVLLSNCKPEELEDKTIKIDIAGGCNISGTIEWNGTKYNYEPIGTDAHPFKGKLDYNAQITVGHTIFGVLSSEATVSSECTFVWDKENGTNAIPIMANEYRFADAKSYKFQGEIKNADSYLFGKITGKKGTLEIGAQVSYVAKTTEKSGISMSGDTDMGLICGTLENGTINLNGYKLPANINSSIKSTDGNAGSLIGTMNEDTTLQLSQDLKTQTSATESNSVITVETTAAAGGNAGGLVGSMNTGAKLAIASSKLVRLKDIVVTGTGNVGGIAGKADEVTLQSGNATSAGRIEIESPKITQTKDGGNVGGLFGTYSLKNQELTLPNWIKLSEPQLVITNGSSSEAGSNAGGLFGTLEFKGKSSYIISDIMDFSVSETGNGRAYGGFVGRVKGNTGADSLQMLKISGCKITSDYSGNKATTNVLYHGGFAGEIGNSAPVYLEVNNTEDKVIDPYAKSDSELGFGGIVGRVKEKSVVKFSGTSKVTTAGGKSKNDSRIWQGGGLVGWAESGSSVELSGTTDLSGVSYAPRTCVGQLVGGQDSALIYARGDGSGNGWKYIRAPKNQMTSEINNTQYDLDDIGNYGQVIRLKEDGTSNGLSSDLIKLDETTHKVVLENLGTYTGNIANTDEFALLAITWQTGGAFNAYTGLDAGILNSKDITLSGDVDLTGTGITGLTRDNELRNVDTYKGTFKGNNYTVKLAIGEAYGVRGTGTSETNLANAKESDATNSDGKIHRHCYLGIFARAEKSNVSNLKLAGKIRFNGMAKDRYSGDNRNYYIGGYAGEMSGTSTADGVTTAETILVSTDSKENKNQNIYASVGGLSGSFSSGTLTLGDKSVVFAGDMNNPETIKIDKLHDTTQTYTGGLIGKIESGVTVNCNNVSLANVSITDNKNSKVQAGGLIGFADYVKTGTFHTVNVKKMSVEGLKINADNATECGGVFGYLWADTDVNFEPSGTDYAMTVKGQTSITASKAGIGGLVYRASGKWTVNDKGISMLAGAFNAKDIGLLVCHMEKDESNIVSGGNTPDADRQHALYLKFTENWETAYNLSGVTANASGIYDEFAAYTAKDAQSVTENNKNGIISLATKAHAGVATGADCNTYQNRINKNKTNPNSRYYYNLDKITKDSGKVNNGTDTLDTPEKLLLWSVWRYASDNLKDEFINNGDKYTTVGADSTTADLDMEGLSYYPVNVYGMNVKHAKITFHNKKIETQESSASNKSTKGDAQGHTQHYMMHCGLFYNLLGGEEGVSSTFSDVTLAGTVGSVNHGSGALFCGNVAGNEDKKKFYTLNVNGVTLSGISVTDADNKKDNAYIYAPVLMNTIGSYATINITNISTDNYGKGTIAGSSLIGVAGNTQATQISLIFKEMKLPDKSAADGGIFTRATFLEKFQYKDIGTAIYTFEKKEDWNGTEHIHQVTYGKEISGSKEYSNLQKWYYDEDTYREADGLVQKQTSAEDSPSFDGYLPYVAVADATASDVSHEIMVNQRVSNLLKGCGTYRDPYKITNEAEMNTISAYLSSNIPRQNWQIQVTKNKTAADQTDESQHLTYQYNGSKWMAAGEEMTNDEMHDYLLNAYYDIQGETKDGVSTLEVSDFGGFGCALYPFRGVITSTTNCMLVLSGNDRSGGLIPYSYGSVIKDLTVLYKGSKTLTYDEAPAQASSIKDTKFESKVFFGGAIGCIIGGDNIIDNVEIKYADDWKLNLKGAYKNLIQAGGYVGSVSGGGLIFRNMSGKSGLADANIDGGSVAGDAAKSLYVNPYVGRVLDGYAFSEDCAVENTNKNYKINKLTKTADDVYTTEASDGSSYTCEIKSAQGLLVLSAIVNSGGASGAKTYAYSKGKVRNATYSNIGNVTDTNTEDYEKSVKDDSKTVGNDNASYLISNYTTGKGTYDLCCKKTKFLLSKNTTYNMKGYGNGYQGIGARYLSSAVNTGESNKIGADYVMPLNGGLEGNNATILMDMQVKEYADDDFHGVSFGGMFNLYRGAEESQVTAAKELNIGNESDAVTVSLQYCDKSGATVTEAGATFTNNAGRFCVGIGGFAGNTAANSGNSKFSGVYTLEKVKVTNGTFKGPNSAGGIFGSTGMSDGNIKAGTGLMFHKYNAKGIGTSTGAGTDDGPLAGKYNKYGISLLNCQYADLTISSIYASGGFIGNMTTNQYKFSSLSTTDVKVDCSLNITENGCKRIGNKSTIEAAGTGEDVTAGGIFGQVNARLSVNTGTDAVESELTNITVTSGRNAGGVVARTVQTSCDIRKISIQSISQGTSQITAGLHAGGIAGYIDTANVSVNIQDCHAKDIAVKGTAAAGQSGIGGIVGNVKGTTSQKTSVKDCTVTATSAENKKTTIHGAENSNAGGIIGWLQGIQPLEIRGCKVENATVGMMSNGYNGGILGAMQYKNKGNLFCYNLSVLNTTISGKEAGGLTSSVYGTVNGANILLNTVQATGSTAGKVGIVIGGSGNLNNVDRVRLAGVSVQGECAPAVKEFGDELSNYLYTAKKGYITFADYSGSALTAETQDSTAGTENDLLGIDAPAAPFVTSSPKSSLKVTDKNGNEKSLFGDGVSWTKSSDIFTMLGKQIMDEKNISLNSSKFPYQKTGVDSFDFTGAFSTYNANQAKKVDNDFPVLRITGGDTGNVENYLNILTNGGYSQAKQLNDSSVSCKTELYTYDTDKKKFVYSQDTPALSYKNSAFKTSSDYDNDKDRFTLLTVTFTAGSEKYHLQIPVIVRRVLEVDFTATLSYGTNFKSSNYDTLTNHILDNYGNPMTGYLTYRYNHASGKYVKYGWENYIKSGGNVNQSLDKSIVFSSGLPKGTQLTLINCQDEKRTAYYYTTTGEEKGKVAISLFKDSAGNNFKQNPVSDALDITMQPNANTGTFVKTTDSVKATVKCGDDYYRLATDSDEDKKADKYEVSVTEDENTENEENYYIVVTIPEAGDKKAWNGYVTTEMGGTIPKHVTAMLRKEKKEDNHSNTASTYQISSGYSQDLSETITGSNKLMSAADSKVAVRLKNKITFLKDQYYNSSDALYQNFTGMLQAVKDQNGKVAYFPSGTNGTAKFYVYKETGTGTTKTKTYYTYSNGSWTEGNATEKEAVSYEWTSKGGNMELPLSTDGTIKNAINLQQIRDKVKQDSSNTDSGFYVEVKLDASIPAIALDVIPKSSMDDNNNLKEYAKMNYIAQLSTEKDSLSYSNAKATLTNTGMKYYREDTANAKLTYDADNIDQLGINLLDLDHNLDKDKKHAIIATTATYDLSSTKELEKVLQNSKGIRFHMTLSPKDNSSTNKEAYADGLKNAKDYMNVELMSAASGSVSYTENNTNASIWSWTIPKESYYADNALKKSTLFDGEKFTQAIRLLVNVDNVESAEHLYANYNVILNAEVLGADGKKVDDTSASDNVIYTLTKIKPSFQE